jgi:hypothetical protein
VHMAAWLEAALWPLVRSPAVCFTSHSVTVLATRGKGNTVQ